MRRVILVPLLMLFIISCSGVKQTQEEINLGNYKSAITTALRNVAENKSKKGNQPYIILLEEAFKKNVDRELQHIAFLKKDNNPANLEAIFNAYLELKDVQEKIKPLLPLQIFEENRQAKFAFKNYDNEIISTKNKLSNYLYKNASTLLETATSKKDYRKSYDDFAYLDKINPNYKDVNQKIQEAYSKGRNYVNVVLINDSEQIIPKKLELDLLNFDTYGLYDKWTVYHSNSQENISYDYEMELAFTDINISPEQLTERQLQREKQIKDGYRYAVNSDGNVVKDSLGNKIKIDKLKTVKCDFYQFTQYKSVQLRGNIRFIDLQTQQQLNSYPLISEFVFNHQYATHEGDIRALEEKLLPLLKQSSASFPSNEQMVYDAGEDIKKNLKAILNRHRFH